ncbi:uncharacterized protein Ilp8 [Drosophila virilis]|uniref:Insulin-like domain-containing protein n=1 Tax=Drosophila virilis TaxID=7244 RepID=B4LBS5_DROVI|nr:uncharacterized protein LOC6624410 [Drosophila virilis]EDW68702.1 uncharacterized protein Dvir_GJ12854 [Drosophila virilis]
MRVKFVLFTLILASCLLSGIRAHCSLDTMKAFAMEACERLFQRDEGRERRSIDYGDHHANKVSHEKMHKGQHYVGRSSYPHGGYLKVSEQHFHRLIGMDVLPRYKPRKQHQLKKLRPKRNSSAKNYSNISYCCYHQCNDDFFC